MAEGTDRPSKPPSKRHTLPSEKESGEPCPFLALTPKRYDVRCVVVDFMLYRLI
jgi:hypothetical protein